MIRKFRLSRHELLFYRASHFLIVLVTHIMGAYTQVQASGLR